MQRVILQAQNQSRMQGEDLLKLTVRNAQGGMVPLSSFATVEWVKAASQVVGYNGYPSVRISGAAAPGQTTGAAIAEMQRLASELPEGFGYEWTGQTLEEIKSGSQAPFLFALSIFRKYELEGDSMVEPYLDVLRAGGSKPPEELAQLVGLDLTDAGIWESGIDALAAELDEAEALAVDVGLG